MHYLHHLEQINTSGNHFDIIIDKDNGTYPLDVPFKKILIINFHKKLIHFRSCDFRNSINVNKWQPRKYSFT